MKVRDTRKLEGDTLACDICVIGAGAAGLAIAAALADSKLDVLIIEAGEEAQTEAGQAFYRGETVNPAHPPAEMYRQRRLGGSTTIWGGRCVPYDPIDFEKREFLPHSGWPITLDALQPYYVRAQTVLDAGAFDYSASKAIGPKPFLDGFTSAIVSTDSIERFSLPTNLWKSLARQLTAATNIRILTQATCTGLNFNDAGTLLEAIDVQPDPDRKIRIIAKRFVIATGGIETARLLLGASSGQGRIQPGNHSDWVGRGYMCHLEASLGELRLTPPQRPIQWGFERTWDGVYARRRFTITAEKQRALGIMNAIVRLNHAGIVDPAHHDGILSTMYAAKQLVIPEYRRKLTMVEHDAAARMEQGAAFWAAHIGNIARDAPRVAAFLASWLYRRHGQKRAIPYVALKNGRGLYALDTNAEQSPNRDSRIMLGDAVDAYGLPRVRIDWRINELDIRTLKTTLLTLKQEVERCGVANLILDEANLDAQCAAAVPVGGHHIGTARMAADPQDGVVDPSLKVHHVANLFLAGASVLPTSSHANPTLTLVALALRLADHLKTAE